MSEISGNTAGYWGYSRAAAKGFYKSSRRFVCSLLADFICELDAVADPGLIALKRHTLDLRNMDVVGSVASQM